MFLFELSLLSVKTCIQYNSATNTQLFEHADTFFTIKLHQLWDSPKRNRIYNICNLPEGNKKDRTGTIKLKEIFTSKLQECPEGDDFPVS